MKIKQTKKSLSSPSIKTITIGDLVKKIQRLLTKNLSLTARESSIECRFILEHGLKVDHQYLIKSYEQLIDPNKFKQIMGLVTERISNKPLAHILKEWKFYDIELHINSNVLIPRQDTELLIDLIREKYSNHEKIDILDLGTGSGAIGIALGKNFQNANILLSDISLKALHIAKKNILRHKLKNISVIQSDWFTNIAKKKFDIIVSNPPYIDKSDPHLRNTELLYEPQHALISEKEGYGDILKIVRQSPKFLKQKGALYIEHGYNQHEKIHRLFLENNFIKIEQNRDLNGVIRTTSGNIKI